MNADIKFSAVVEMESLKCMAVSCRARAVGVKVLLYIRVTNTHHRDFEYIVFPVYLNGYIPVDASGPLDRPAWRDFYALCDSLLP